LPNHYYEINLLITQTKLKKIMNVKTILFLICTFSFLLSCSDDAIEDDINPLVINAKFNAIVEDVSQIIIEQYYQEQANLTDNLPSCASVSIATSGVMWTRTITFTNCTLPNGNVLNGNIIITSNNSWDIATKIVYSFDGFTHNGIQVSSEETVVEKTFESTSSQTDIHPVFKMNFRMNLILPVSLEEYRLNGTRTKEIIAGYNTPFLLSDNIYTSSTGNWNLKYLFDNSTDYATITEPLSYNPSSCSYVTSGVITYTSLASASIDFGDGTCDEFATIRIYGRTATISLDDF
jgi:hypothetical protein